jgi:hypothetical protein
MTEWLRGALARTIAMRALRRRSGGLQGSVFRHDEPSVNGGVDAAAPSLGALDSSESLGVRD